MKIVCFGDSITATNEGYSNPILTTMLKQKLTKHTVINAGISGDSTVSARKRLEKEVLEESPDLVTILFGANDSAAHKLVPLKHYEENLRYFVQEIGSEHVILITPTPIDESLQPHRSNDRTKQYAEIVKKIAEDTGCYLIDFFKILYEREDYKEILVGIQNDGLHFGEEGYVLLSNLIVEQIRLIEKSYEEKVK